MENIRDPLLNQDRDRIILPIESDINPNREEDIDEESSDEYESEEEEEELEQEPSVQREPFYETLGRPEYYHIWAILGCASEALLNIVFLFLSIYSVSNLELKSNCDVRVQNILTTCGMFILFVRLNSVCHIMNFLWQFNMSGAYTPIALFFTEVVTSIALFILKFYWAKRERSCHQGVGYYLVLIYNSLFYFFVTRLAFFLCIPCFYVIVLCIQYIYNKRQQRRRTRKFRRLPTYKFKDYQEKFGEVSHKECWICLEEYQPDSEIYEFPCVSHHLYHKECISQWYQKSDRCPVDRSRYEGSHQDT
ncbi:unnamed protein product [Moneuplotes crassus]|uniref:RING-type domain-containing protein n=1 Tax=Euplotes crassus TaxID=5936 RepID=A0AAD2D0C2_EUPCR|nr:unnamed protein product [Moneuplotes crassus]